MSPATISFTSLCSLPWSWNTCPSLIGFVVADVHLLDRCRPWWTRKIASFPTNGSVVTLNTCASSGFFGSFQYENGTSSCDCPGRSPPR